MAPDGVGIDTFWLGPPKNDSTTAIEWAGEWTVTYETFRRITSYNVCYTKLLRS